MEDLHITFDLETLGRSPDSAIVQIGAVVFDPSKPPNDFIVSKFLTNVDIDSNLKYGRKIESETLKFWFRNDHNISWLDDTKTLDHALRAFNMFLNKFPKRMKVWTHLSFDWPILESAYRATEIEFPFKYYYAYDQRTLVYISESKPWDNGKDPKNHNALDDCIFQATYITERLKNLMSRYKLNN